MTREEAINKVQGYLIDYLPIEDYEELDEIIKALEKESCEDAISRQSVLDMATVIETDDYSGNEIMEVVDTDDIKALPSVTPAPKKERWIPCDVGLPKQNEYIGNVCKYYLVQDCYGDMYVARYTKKGWNPIDSLFFLDDVVAWMPLPEKYKAEMEEEEDEL